MTVQDGVLRSKESGPKRLCKNTWASYISTGSVAGRDRLVVMAVTYARTIAGSPEIDIYGFTRRIPDQDYCVGLGNEKPRNSALQDRQFGGRRSQTGDL
jgi:hypothetical protein